MCDKNSPTDEDLLTLASQDKPITRDELGIKSPATKDGLRTLAEGFDFLQSLNLNENNNDD